MVYRAREYRESAPMGFPCLPCSASTSRAGPPLAGLVLEPSDIGHRNLGPPNPRSTEPPNLKKRTTGGAMAAREQGGQEGFQARGRERGYARPQVPRATITTIPNIKSRVVNKVKKQQKKSNYTGREAAGVPPGELALHPRHRGAEERQPQHGARGSAHADQGPQGPEFFFLFIGLV